MIFGVPEAQLCDEEENLYVKTRTVLSMIYSGAFTLLRRLENVKVDQFRRVCWFHCAGIPRPPNWRECDRSHRRRELVFFHASNDHRHAFHDASSAGRCRDRGRRGGRRQPRRGRQLSEQSVSSTGLPNATRRDSSHL